MTGRTTTGRRVFAADVHIHPRDPSRAKRFFEWLDSERDRAEVVYLLGDLFDLWVGSPNLIFDAFTFLRFAENSEEIKASLLAFLESSSQDD